MYVRSLTGAGGRLRASPGVGTEPRWGAEGRDLYYRSGDSVYRVEVTPGGISGVGLPRAVWGGRHLGDAQRASWDVSPDGRRYVFLRGAPSNVLRLQVILHWFENHANSNP